MGDLKERLRAIYSDVLTDHVMTHSERVEEAIDQTLALPELAPLRDGETLYRECPMCHGSRWVNATQDTTWIDPCPTCGGDGYIALAERGASDGP